MTLLIVAAVATLAVMRVRDPLCWVLWLTMVPLAGAIALGNTIPLLCLALAGAWRLRDGRFGGALCLAAAIVVKPLLAVMVVWLVATRRYRQAAWTAATSAVLMVASWAAISFRGLADYPALLQANRDLFAHLGAGVQPLVLQLGGSDALALAVGVVVGLVVIGACVAVRDDDVSAFALALVACLALSPIVWAHYLAMLVVPIAARSPSFSRLWLVLPALCVTVPFGPMKDSAALSIFVLVVMAAFAAGVVARRPRWVKAGRRAVSSA